MFLRFNNLLAPETPTPSGGGLPAGSGKEDVIKFLGEDDSELEPDDIIPLDEPKDKDKDKGKSKTSDKTSDEDTPEDDDEEKDEEDELDDLVDELEDPDESKLELVTPVRRKEILAKYPKLFKDFPYLETAYYREQQFTKLFPTMDDAKSAQEAVETVENFEKDLVAGNTQAVLAAVKQANPKAFNKVVDNYLTTLNEVDPKAYTHVIGNVIKHTIYQMVAEGRKSNNKTLEQAASILNQFVFMTSEYTPPSRLSSDKDDEPSPKDNEISERERKFAERQIKSAQDDLDTKVNNSYKSTIEANIDPKGTMSDYVRGKAIEEALVNLESNISKDSRFKIIIDKLWENAKRNDFDKPSLDRIRSAYISRARTLLPTVIKSARNAALKGMGKRVVEDKDDEVIRKTTRSEKSRSQSSDRNDKAPKGKIPAGMSSLEFLMADDD